MPGPEHELAGFQPNPNEFGKCNHCGTLLKTKEEEEVKLCKDCQQRHKAQETDYDDVE
ncbi:hypothetical protein [Salimicrobium halophilum]|uniref:Uncharacterized protein n=1 Tax=Salimicrobium halophilum TaxID=86666 RepID=A0A1G8SSD6_9BACI|nr:hypothetical protein [Salimicrobium halophilum]SDJ32172.1 hypothetical protein SAMN04490247_1503 [Salimicrobium halophilum]